MLKGIFGKRSVKEGLGSNLDTCLGYLAVKQAFSRDEYLALYLNGIADFSKTLEKNPDDAMTYLLRGDAYRNIGEGDLAIADYEKAIEVSTDQSVIISARKAIQSTREQV